MAVTLFSTLVGFVARSQERKKTSKDKASVFYNNANKTLGDIEKCTNDYDKRAILRGLGDELDHLDKYDTKGRYIEFRDHTREVLRGYQKTAIEKKISNHAKHLQAFITEYQTAQEEDELRISARNLVFEYNKLIELEADKREYRDLFSKASEVLREYNWFNNLKERESAIKAEIKEAIEKRNQRELTMLVGDLQSVINGITSNIVPCGIKSPLIRYTPKEVLASYRDKVWNELAQTVPYLERKKEANKSAITLPVVNTLQQPQKKEISIKPEYIPVIESISSDDPFTVLNTIQSELRESMNHPKNNGNIKVVKGLESELRESVIELSKDREYFASVELPKSQVYKAIREAENLTGNARAWLSKKPERKGFFSKLFRRR